MWNWLNKLQIWLLTRRWNLLPLHKRKWHDSECDIPISKGKCDTFSNKLAFCDFKPTISLQSYMYCSMLSYLCKLHSRSSPPFLFPNVICPTHNNGFNMYCSVVRSRHGSFSDCRFFSTFFIFVFLWKPFEMTCQQCDACCTWVTDSHLSTSLHRGLTDSLTQ